MYKVVMMKDRTEGYKTIGYYKTVEEAREMVLALNVYHRPVDIYYSRAN